MRLKRCKLESKKDNPYSIGPRDCPECEKLKSQKRKCLKCGKLFTPKCLAKFLCARCIAKNRKEEDNLDHNIGTITGLKRDFN